MSKSLAKLTVLPVSAPAAEDLRSTIDSAPRRSSVSDGVRKDYVCDTSHSPTQRAAHFLAWCAKNYPETLIPWTLVYMAVYMLSKAPPSTSKDVTSLRSKSPRIRIIVSENYKTALIAGPNKTVRATTGDEDTARNALPGRVRRVASANNSLAKTASLVDSSKIKDKELKKWVVGSVEDVLNSIESGDFYNKLLPPKKD